MKMDSVGWVLVTLALVGCTGGITDRVPGQDTAERIVWRDLYGEEGDPPTVEWLHTDTGYLPNGTIHGLILPGWKIQLGIAPTMCPPDLYGPGPGFECSLSGSAYAHELMHAHTFNRTGDIDAAHWRGDWDLADNGAFYALVAARL